MSGYSGLDFKSVGAELAYWLGHVTSAFKGGFPGSGENGYDFGMPEGTPVYAILPGKVVGVGSYGGGGVVSVQYNSQNIIYYQHLRANQVAVGDTINVGQQVGLSGGLHNTDGSPVSCCSSYAHIEVGDNAPFGGIWNPNNVKPNIDPISLFTSLAAQYKSHDVSTGGSGGLGIGGIGGLVGGTTTLGANSSNCAHPLVILGQQVACIPDTVYNWITQPIRFGKVFLGMIMIATAILLLAIPVAGKVAGPVTQVAGVATGQPELVAAGGAISSAQGKRPVATVQVPANAAPRRAPRTKELNMEAAPETAPIDQQPPPPKGKLGATPNPMTAAQIAKAQMKRNPPGTAAASTAMPTPPILASTPPPQRAGPTGLTDTYTLGATRTMSGEPIPDAEHLQTIQDIHKPQNLGGLFDPANAKYYRGAPSMDEALRDLRGGTPAPPAANVPGTQRTVASEQAHLKDLQDLLAQETNAAVRKNLQRDIKATQQRIKKMQGG